MKHGGPWYRPELRHQSVFDIVTQYQSVYRGVVNFYRLAQGATARVVGRLNGLNGWNLASRLPYLIWGFQYVAGFRRRHAGASIQQAWTTSLDNVRATLDADSAMLSGPCIPTGTPISE